MKIQDIYVILTNKNYKNINISNTCLIKLTKYFYIIKLINIIVLS